ncbi:MAG TPA: hypothetical protein VLI46_02500 [Ramlibacter sp.]|nr:hypothetical protein [Ramlibacter sp.]
MNAVALDADTDMLESLVAFKWLMAGKGWWVDLPRLRRDAQYVRDCALRGLEHGLPLPRECAAGLSAMAPSSSCETQAE